MKRIEWLIVSIMLVMGLLCLTMSATLINPSSMQAYFDNFFQICIWIAIPVIAAALLYMFIRSKKK